MKLSADRLRKVLTYDPETGVFTRVASRIRTDRVGVVAGTKGPDGRVTVSVGGQSYRAHRLAFLYMTGEWPLGEVDHIDGRPDNNRWMNLRPSDRVHNTQNQHGPHRDSSTGLLGVVARRGGFSSSICVRRKRHYLGWFPTALEAHEAYLRAKRQLHESCTI